MPFQTLNREKWKGTLKDCKISIRHRGAPDDVKIIEGGTVSEVKKSYITYASAGRETTIPHHRILEDKGGREAFMEEKHKKRMLQVHGYSSEDRSFKRWKEIQDWKKVLRNYVIMMVCKALPDNEFKNRIYRKTGVRIGKNVSIFGSNLDIFFPELIEIGDGSIIGMLTSLITHEFLTNGWRNGHIKIGKNVTIGAMTLILPGVTIGDGAVVAAYSLVNKDVEPGSFVGGVPIKRIR